MTISQKEDFTKKLYEILATLQYNRERRMFLEETLRLFLAKRTQDFSAINIAKKAALEKIRKAEKQHGIDISTWFEQSHLLYSNIPSQYIPEYIIYKFSQYGNEFKKKFGFDINSLWIFSFMLYDYFQYKKEIIGLKDDVYVFKSKKEYADPSFIVPPPEPFTKAWENVVTFDVAEIERLSSGFLSNHEFEEVLVNLSMTSEQLSSDPKEISLHLKPLLLLDDIVILLTPWYLVNALPPRYEILFRQIKPYMDTKGRSFERLVRETLRRLPFEGLIFNVCYGKNYETDALIKFEKSVWCVEVSSHPPAIKSLEGDINSIKNDLKKAIWKCINQGRRCVKHSSEPSLSLFSKGMGIKGILIVLDGSYPQLNPTTVIKLFDIDVPVYIINWFDLRTLIDQPELGRFEDFLLWRTQKPMHVTSFDERDYWAFFFNDSPLAKKFKENFNLMQRSDIHLLYISDRFNLKKHLRKLVGG